MTKKLDPEISTSNGVAAREAAFIGTSPDYAITFDIKDLADFELPTFTVPEASRLANGMHFTLRNVTRIPTDFHLGSTSKFQTDVDISGNQNRGERLLQKWEPDGPANTDFSLESNTNGSWDQFAANQQLFGAQSTYDESYYTTTIDRGSESYRQREARAAKLAREIEGSQSANQHVREERGQAAQNEPDDEEAKYSGVRRQDGAFPPLPTGGQNKYTPPARRPPTGQPTVAGAPYDSAIVSAQLSRPDAKAFEQRQKSPDVPKQVDTSSSPLAVPTDKSAVPSEGSTTAEAAILTPKTTSTNPAQTDGVEAQLLQRFRQFKNSEITRIEQRKKVQASNDRTAKLNELLRFSRDFKLHTPVPSDLVGILAKDPQKQEEIVQKAKRETDGTSTNPHPSAVPVKGVPIRPQDIAPIPPFQGGRGRGLPPSASMRLDKTPSQQGSTSMRGPSGPAKASKAGQPQVPAPIPLVDVRLPPTGPMAEQGMSSPQRSTMQTPPSAASSAKFNLNVRASEFKPSVNAPSFNPAPSNAPSSPASMQQAGPVSRTASPSVFFGSRKPKAAAERPSIAANFNSIKKLKQNTKDALVKYQSGKWDNTMPPPKDYASNGGIPNAFLTAPRWQVAPDNEEKTYLSIFERPQTTPSPVVSRTGSAQQVPYHQQMTNMPGSSSNVGHPHPAAQGATPAFGHQYDDQQRMMMMPAPGQVYPSPGMQSRQTSTYASPMQHPAQLNFGQQTFYPGAAGQMPMRPYPGGPHGQGQMGIPMMMPQGGGGYHAMPQQFNAPMQMYSPTPGHVYPQQNGYGSPGRAPMMMQQGSQQGHHHAPPMVWSGSAQGGPMGYGQPYRGGYQASYGSSPQQPFPGQQQRTMSGGYGQIPQKMMHMPQGHNSHQPASYSQGDAGQEVDSK
jgi:hypothetical protein